MFLEIYDDDCTHAYNEKTETQYTVKSLFDAVNSDTVQANLF
jgi:hypothetical protein